jgi:hypothetical protein
MYIIDFLRIYILVVVGLQFSVGIETVYGLGGHGIESRWGRNFPLPSRPTLGPTQPPTQWVPGNFRWVKRPGCGVKHPPPSSAEVKETVELYLYSLCGPSLHVLGRTLPLPLPLVFKTCVGVKKQAGVCCVHKSA